MPFTAMSVGWEAAFRIKRPPDTPNRLNRLRGTPCLEVDHNWPDTDLCNVTSYFGYLGYLEVGLQ